MTRGPKVAVLQVDAPLAAGNTKYIYDGKENVIDDMCALMAATELWIATDDPAYRDDAHKRMQNLASRVTPEGYFRSNDGNRPFGYARQTFLYPANNGWGVKDSLAQFAENQLSWILGMNPYSVTFMHGFGKTNPPLISALYGHGTGKGSIANEVTGRKGAAPGAPSWYAGAAPSKCAWPARGLPCVPGSMPCESGMRPSRSLCPKAPIGLGYLSGTAPCQCHDIVLTR